LIHLTKPVTLPPSFVDVGAYDGWDQSKTAFFDVCLQWPGLVIEANPYIYASLLGKRRTIHKLGFSPTCSKEEEKEGKVVAFSKVKWLNAGLTETEGIDSVYKNQTKFRVEVPCGSLAPALVDVFPDRHVHFLSMNVNGAEALVLENMEFDKVFIDVILIDLSGTCRVECTVAAQVANIMKKTDYQHYDNIVPLMDVYVHKKSKYKEMADNYAPPSAQVDESDGDADADEGDN
jgi:hypothetical protein